MTIKEWLTPDFFALNVILIALMMNLSIYAVVGNFTVDFKMNERFETGIYTAIITTVFIYAIMVVLGFLGAISRYPYLYDNKYNFLLLGIGPAFGGNGPVFLAILSGIFMAVILGIIAGKQKTLRGVLAVGAVASNAIIVAITLLWIVNQT